MVTRLLLALASVGVGVSVLGCGGGAGSSGKGGVMAGDGGSGGGAVAGSGGTCGAAGSVDWASRAPPGPVAPAAVVDRHRAAPAGPAARAAVVDRAAARQVGDAAVPAARRRAAARQLLTAAVGTSARARPTARCGAGALNNNGQLGDGTMTDTARPVQVTALGSVVQVSAGDSHTCARKTDGTLWCWGYNNQGTLGDGTTTRRTSPVQVTALGASVVEVSAGGAQTCARKADGTLWCWGGNSDGAVGDGTMTDALTPVQVTALGSDVAEVDAGNAFTCARKTDNTLWCWGANTFGKLGDGTVIGHPLPAQVIALGNMVAHVALGYENVCVLKTDGTTWCWGLNLFGTVGDGTTTDRLTPAQAPSLATDVVQLSLHEAHACARKADGTIWCWGDSHYGSLGLEEGTDDRSVPIQVKGFSGAAVELTTGRYHNCVRLGDGSVWCWGYDTHGELGAGTVSMQPCYESTNYCRPKPAPVVLPCL